MFMHMVFGTDINIECFARNRKKNKEKMMRLDGARNRISVDVWHIKGSIFSFLGRTAGFLIVLTILLTGQALAVTDVCPPFYLKTDTGAVINPITGENADQPYSTRKTCGACHDVDTISNGYHFMMDWDKAGDQRFENTETPWLVSTGLTGGMTPYGYYFLAKKKNSHSDEIDLSVFDFIGRSPGKVKGFQKPGCAACHPGGGMLEKDRDGQRYDLRLAASPELAETLDGDYYKSKWDKTGIIEPDCFICHSSRYSIQTRIIQMKNLNFKWATVAASGIGQVKGMVAGGQVPKVIYNRRLFNEDGKFILSDMVFRPEAGNCLICHESIELGKRGFSWDDPKNPDVHQWAGLTCIDCHFGDIGHNFAKGNAMANFVADEQDNSMKTCRDCHETGFKGATAMKHSGIKKDHLNKLSCEACHIPELGRSAIGAMYVNTGRFGKIGQPGTRRFGEEKPWKPAYVVRIKDKDGKPRITPVNPFYTSLFTIRSKDGIYIPLFLSEMEKAYLACGNQLSKRKHANDFHRSEDKLLMLKTLKETLKTNQRFQTIDPVFHQGGMKWALDEHDNLYSEKDDSWVEKIPYFSVSHNVAPKEKALGAGGCTDCHSTTSHLFNGTVVTNFFGKAGQPELTPMIEFSGISSAAGKWNRFFSAYLGILPFIIPTALIICFGGFIIAIVPGGGGLRWINMISGIGFLMVLGLVHLAMTNSFKTLTGWLTNEVSGWFVQGLLLLLAAGIFIRFVQTTTEKRVLRPAAIAICFFTAVPGIILWVFPGISPEIGFYIWGLHAVSAMVAVIVVFLLFIFQ